MKVMLVAMKYDYGDPTRGLSLEHFYFEKPLSSIVATVIHYDFMEVINRIGRERMNQDLLANIKREHPDITIFVPYTDQFIPEVIDDINQHTITIGYFFDDVWRVEYSHFWAGHFRYVTTSDVNGIKRWRDAGRNNFVYSPFGAAHQVFGKHELEKIYDISFVGQYHPYRAWCLRQLRRSGFRVNAWGHGWPAGRLDFQDVARVFNQSRINLNLSNNNVWDIRYILSVTRPVKDTLRVLRNTVKAVTCADNKTREMVKARHFEINSCGGFQLCHFVEGLERHYVLGDEVVVYGSIDDLIYSAGYYLRHADERECIAERGYQRTMRDHTMEQRLMALLKAIGGDII
jgi:spore maturation protein CgeB